MRRGTTPTLTISTDADLTPASNLFVTFTQNGEPVFEKTLEDVTLTSETVTVLLTQNETLLMKSDAPVQFQIRASIGDMKLASNIMTASVDQILKNGVI